MPTAKLGQPLKQHFTMTGPGWVGVEGRIYAAFTNKGRPIKVWVPDPANDRNHRYFCHGRTLGTYEKHNYSVFSGDDVLKVLNDEFQARGTNLAGVQQGDVVSWQSGNAVVHTCMIVNCNETPKTPANITVWTKNGALPETVCTLAAVMKMYGDVYLLWRP